MQLLVIFLYLVAYILLLWLFVDLLGIERKLIHMENLLAQKGCAV